MSLSQYFEAPESSLHFVLVDREPAATIVLFATPPSSGSGYGMAVFPRHRPPSTEVVDPGLWDRRPRSCSTGWSLSPQLVGSVGVLAGFVDPSTTMVRVVRGGHVVLEHAVHDGMVSLQTPFAAQVEFLRGAVVWAAVPTLRGRLPVRGVVVSATCRTAADAFLTAVAYGAQPPAGIDASGMAPPSIATDLHDLLAAGGWSVSGQPVRHVTNFAYPLTTAGGGKATLWVTAALIGGRCRVFNYNFIAR